MAAPTAENLAKELEKANAPQWLIDEARANSFHDYLSDRTFPEVDLVINLRNLNMNDFAQRVIDGEFDASKEESDAWAASPEGQEIFQELVNTKPRGPLK
jgi:hypothetical protein